MTQLTLDLSKPSTRRKAGPNLARRMIAILAVNRGWITRREFKSNHGIDDRACRLGRECAHGRIIRGNLGYKLLAHATPEEIRKACNAWLSQIEAEQEQYRLLIKRAHKTLAEKVA